jgi:hypothetical protein
MLIVYGLNGAVQSMIFPSLMVIISTNLLDKHKLLGLSLLTIASPVSLILTNALVILFAEVLNFYFIYLFAALSIFIVTVCWFSYSKIAKSNLVDVKINTKIAETGSNWDKLKPLKLFWMTGILIFFVTAICRGLIENGTATWIPTMIMESYKTTPSFSLFLTMFLPIASIAGSFASIYAYKKIKCEIKTTIFFLAMIILPLTGLIFIGKISIIFSIFLLFAVYLFKYGFYQMINMQIPARFGSLGKASLVAGIINAMASVGFALASYVFGFIAEEYSWKITIIFWIGIAVIGIIFSILSLKKWRYFTDKLDKIKKTKID